MNRLRVTPGPIVTLTALWLATRALMLWLTAYSGAWLPGGDAVTREVWRLYHHWYGVLAHGSFPVHDTLWQYPPGAGAVLLAPGLLPGLTYFQAFVLLTLAVDALTAAALLRAGSRPGRSLRGATLWTGGLPLLLHLPLARYDVQVTALAVLSLLAMARSPRAGGAFAALGALVKVWPALVLLGTPRGRPARGAWLSAVWTGAGCLAVLAVFFTHPLSFLREQGGRGVQIESLGGTALNLARRFGWSGRSRYQYGAVELVGPHVRAVAVASLTLTVLSFGLLVLWRVRARYWSEATPFDAALSAVLLFTVTSRVISPQYMIWLIGLAAVCLTSRHTAQRPVAVLVLAASALSTVAFPVYYREVIDGTWAGCLLMLARNGLLTAAAVLSFVRLWRSARPPAGGTGPTTRPRPDSDRLPDRALSAS
ncbi:glycosyltransferase 87 family protein [Streptomyces lavenduligriseus]|uniref:Glycosyltransferase 87 family protein n=1 Tax=Streptomyces lavenduligriseus TaxID=67315 RepID=A0ABT0NYU0_9ACTN|nr:glycosyltransferase 87 family protein [Streptomyces lavenduligriseus]MCL3996664.1 glycosyltransferase 87 family protein [Streptomyces lavenduligriseus]